MKCPEGGYFAEVGMVFFLLDRRQIATRYKRFVFFINPLGPKVRRVQIESMQSAFAVAQD